MIKKLFIIALVICFFSTLLSSGALSLEQQSKVLLSNESKQLNLERLFDYLEEISTAIEAGEGINEGQMANITEEMNYLFEDLNLGELTIEPNQCETEWLTVIREGLHLLRSILYIISDPNVDNAFSLIINAIDFYASYIKYIECLGS